MTRFGTVPQDGHGTWALAGEIRAPHTSAAASRVHTFLMHSLLSMNSFPAQTCNSEREADSAQRFPRNVAEVVRLQARKVGPPVRTSVGNEGPRPNLKSYDFSYATRHWP